MLWSLLHDTSPLVAGLEGAGIDLLFARDWAEMRMDEAARAKGEAGLPEPNGRVERTITEAGRNAARFPKNEVGDRGAALGNTPHVRPAPDYVTMG